MFVFAFIHRLSGGSRPRWFLLQTRRGSITVSGYQSHVDVRDLFRDRGQCRVSHFVAPLHDFRPTSGLWLAFVQSWYSLVNNFGRSYPPQAVPPPQLQVLRDPQHGAVWRRTSEFLWVVFATVLFGIL